MPRIRLNKVSRSYGQVTPVRAVVDVDLTINSGEYVSIVGPSGSGKTTLLGVLGCLDAPSLGSYHFDGVDVATMDDNARSLLRALRIGFVFQTFHLMAHRSVEENVYTALMYAGVSRSERSSRVNDALQIVGLANRASFLTKTLSGGEKQRVAIARAIVKQPELLLCDEPTGNLDSSTSAPILDLLDQLVGPRGLTLVVVTHDHSVSKRASRGITMQDGKVTKDEQN